MYHEKGHMLGRRYSMCTPRKGTFCEIDIELSVCQGTSTSRRSLNFFWKKKTMHTSRYCVRTTNTGIFNKLISIVLQCYMFKRCMCQENRVQLTRLK